MRCWLALALCLLSTRALAQNDPGPPLPQPPPSWQDPYAATIVQLRHSRPSRWPIALMSVGSLAVAVGSAGLVAPEPTTALTRAEGGVALAVGAAAIGTGAYLYRRVIRKRREIDEQIRQLQVTRALNVAPLAHAPTLLVPRPQPPPPPASEPIPAGSGPLALILSGSVIGGGSMIWLYLVGTDTVNGSTLPPAISLAVGSAMAITGIVLLDQLRRRQRSRVDLSLAPLLLRW